MNLVKNLMSTKLLQENLKKLGFYKGSIDDIYGNQTAQAVVELQNVLSELNLYNFKSDGIFGKLTLEGLLEYQKILKIEQDNKDSKVLHTTNKLDYKQFLFGKVLSDSFLDSVYWIADQLKHTEVKAIDLANDLIACMHWESGGTFSPSIRNAAGSGACVDTETEILTTVGWKKYNEVKIGDEIFNIDYDDGQLLTRDVIQDLVIKQSNNNYRLTSRSFDALTTHDHRWYLTQRLYCRTDNAPEVKVLTTEEIANLKSSHTYFIPHISSTYIDDSIRYNELHLYLFTLIGLIAGDGSISKSRDRVELNASKLGNPGEIELIHKCHIALFGDDQPKLRYMDEEKTLFRWNYNSVQSKFLIQFFDEKYNEGLEQSRFVKKLNPELIRILDNISAKYLVTGYVSSDGNINPDNKSISFRNAEQVIIDDFLTASTIAGYTVCQVKTNYRGGTTQAFPNGREYVVKDIHTAYIRKSPFTSCANNQLKVEHLTEEITVWCPTTSNGNFIAKRNGTIYVTGNCGLIQFMPSTAKALGTTTDKLAKMSQIEQLNYVYKYFLPYKGKLRNLGDVYMAILWPKAVGYPDTYVLWNKNKMPTTYRQNSGLDVNKDGTITRAECLVKIRERVVLGKKNMRV